MPTARLTLLLVTLIAGEVPAHAQNYPPVEELVRQVRAALSRGFDTAGVTYTEHRRDVDISMLGKVTVGPIRTFEVYPAAGSGQTYKRLVAVDGRPLGGEELAKRDAEHQRHLREAASRATRETPRERAARLREAEDERRETEAILDDAVAVFQPVFAGRETIDQRPVIVVELRPRLDVETHTRQGRWMQHFAGRIWVDEADHEIVRLDMKAVRDVTVGWGIVGRIDEGSRITFSRRRFENRWLPAELSYDASGRTLLVRPFRFAVTTTYADYRRS